MNLQDLVNRQRGRKGVYEPTYNVFVSIEPEPEPVGSSMVADLDAVYGATNQWWGGTVPAAGPEGDPSRTFSGDLGALVGNGTGILAPNVSRDIAGGDGRALPISKVPSRSLADATPYSARAQFGVR